MATEPLRMLLIEESARDHAAIGAELMIEAPGGSTLKSASTLREAFRFLGALSFDLVITDLRLPDSRAPEALDALGKVCPPGSLFVVTGTEETGLEALRCGAADCLLRSDHDARTLRRSIRHALERFRRLRTDEARHRAERREAVRRLAAGIAHHFNNLLQIVIGNAGLISAATEDRADVALHVKEILDASVRANLLTGHLAHFTDMEEAAAALSVNETLRSFDPILREALGDRIDLVLDLDDDVDAVPAQRIAIEQSMLILALNGREAMRDGGRLTVSTRRGDRAPVEFVVVTVAGAARSRAGLSSGRPGMTMPQVDVGDGMGLAAIHGIVEQAGGHLERVYDPCTGTALSIHLPAVRTVPDMGSHHPARGFPLVARAWMDAEPAGG